MAEVAAKKLTGSAGLYSADIDWFLNVSDAAMGIRSSLSSQIAVLERMGAHVNANHEPYTDRQLGWGRTLKGAFTRNRRLNAAWQRVDPAHHRTLYAHYVWRLPTLARLKYGRRRWAPWPLGAEGQLGQFVGVALMLATDSGELRETLRACERSRGQDLAGLLRRAERMARDAHEAFRAAQQAQADAWVAA